MPVEKAPANRRNVRDVAKVGGKVLLATHDGVAYYESEDVINERLGVDPKKDYAEAVYWPTGEAMHDTSVRNRYLGMGYTQHENPDGSFSFRIPKAKRDEHLKAAEQRALVHSSSAAKARSLGLDGVKKAHVIEEKQAPVGVDQLLAGT